MRSKEQFFEQQPKIETVEQKLNKARKEAGETEIITEIPAGQLVEEVVWRSIRDKKPVCLDELSESGEVIHLNKDIFVNKKFLLRSDNKEINFKKFLPRKNIYFIRDKYNDISGYDDEFLTRRLYKQCTRKDGKKTMIRAVGDIVIYGDLSKSGNVLSLLHEIGHLWADKKLLKTFDKILAKMDIAYFEGLTMQDDKKQNSKKPGPEETLYHSPGADPEDAVPISKDLYLKMEKLQAKLERDAWAYALNILRQYRRQGFDLEPTLKNLEEIKNFLTSEEALGYYQKELNKHIKDKIGIYVRKR